MVCLLKYLHRDQRCMLLQALHSVAFGLDLFFKCLRKKTIRRRVYVAHSLILMYIDRMWHSKPRANKDDVEDVGSAK